VRKADLKKRHISYDNAIDRYRSFTEKVINARRVLGNVQEKRDLAESVTLRVCAQWEYFVDELLTACVNCNHSKLNEFLGVHVPKHPSQELCRALIFGDRYVDFPSFGALKGFSRKLLPDESNPFLSIRRRNWNKIDEVYAIRNYLSHYSQKSKRSLFTMYKNNHGMTRFYEPGQFLLAYEASRLWEYFDAFKGVSDDMKAWY